MAKTFSFEEAQQPTFDIALQEEKADPRIADIARSIYQQESSAGKNTKTSNAGAVGGMQVIPSTFKEVADDGWDINNPLHNARAGIRYVKQMSEKAGGDPALTAAGYYGGPGGLEKARKGIAVSDPRNPKAPNTLEYGRQVAERVPARAPKGVVVDTLNKITDAVLPSANAEEVPGRAKGGAPVTFSFEEALQPAPGATAAAPAAAASPAAASAPATPQKRSMIEDLGRQLGLTVRAGVSGAAALPAIAADAVVAPINAGLALYDRMRAPSQSELVTGKQNGYRIPRQGDALNNVLTAAGLPAPADAQERVVQDMAGAVAGAGGVIKGGLSLANAARTPVAKAVGEGLAAGPKLQLASAVAGSGAAGVTRENGGGTGAQLAAGLAGSLVPSLAPAAGAATLRGALRGGEAGRQKIAKNLETFEAAGVQPTLGQVAGGQLQRAEALAGKAPGGSGVIARYAEKQADDMAASVQKLSDELAPGANAMGAGEAIERGVQAFKNGFKSVQQQLYSKLDENIPADTRIAVEKTRAALADLNADIAGAPALSKWFKNARIQGIDGAMTSDTGGIKSVLSRPGMQEKADALRNQLVKESQNAAAANERHMGNLRLQTDEAREANKAWRQKQFDAAAAARRANDEWRDKLRSEAAQTVARNNERRALGITSNLEKVLTNKEINALPDKVPVMTAKEINALPEPNLVMSERDIKTIKPPNIVRTDAEIQKEVDDFLQTKVDNKLPYEALKKLRTLVGRELADNNLVSDVPRSKWTALYAALSDDLGVAAKQAGPKAEKAWDYANRYTSKKLTMLEQLSKIVTKDAPEKIFNAATNGSAEGTTTIRRVFNALPMQERREVTAAVIQRMGRATAGQQNAMGDAFSSETFLTNLSKLSPQARQTLFGRTDVKGIEAQIGKFADVAQMRRESGRVFANPSGSASTGAQLVNAAAVGSGITTSIATGTPLPLLGTLLPAITANIGAKALTNPANARRLAATTELRPGAAATAVGAAGRVGDTSEPPAPAAPRTFTFEEAMLPTDTAPVVPAGAQAAPQPAGTAATDAATPGAEGQSGDSVDQQDGGENETAPGTVVFDDYDPDTLIDSERRPDGTLAITGNAESVRETLIAAGIPARSLVMGKQGLMVGRTQADRVEQAIAAIKQEQSAASEQKQLASQSQQAQPAIQTVANNGVTDETQAIADQGAQTDALPAAVAAGNEGQPTGDGPFLETDSTQLVQDALNVQDPSTTAIPGMQVAEAQAEAAPTQAIDAGATAAAGQAAAGLPPGDPGLQTAGVAEPPAVATIRRLKDAGEDAVAKSMQAAYDREQTLAAVQTELAGLQQAAPDLPHHNIPDFQRTYQEQRIGGVKPAEAAARAGIMAAVHASGPGAGMPEKAITALLSKIGDMPIEDAPGFVQRFTKALIDKGVVKPFPGADRVESMIAQARDGAMHAMVASAYSQG